MNKNLNVIASELFDKIRTQFPNLALGDENSEPTSEPEDARFFEFDYKHKGRILGRISVSLSEDDGLVVIYSNDVVDETNDVVKKQFYSFLKELREFAKQHLLTFDTRDIAKSNLEKRDYEHLSQTNFGESKMSESKLFGTSMTSYQNLGNAKLIVKHSAPINAENPAGRAQRIESIYVENLDGERFKYPYRHLNGARALAQHVGNGGTPYDSIGKYVIGLSEELGKLRMFKHYVEKNDTISEAMGSVTSKVMERIDSIKKEIHRLQSPSNYKEFAEAFTENEEISIPEEVMNDWIDRLTVRSFNEELKNVFPYIFKLVDETDIPVKEIGVDDLVETSEESELEASQKEVPEVVKYEAILNRIAEGADLFGDDNQDIIAQLNELLAEPIPAGVDGTNATESLQGIIDDEELLEVFKELGEVAPDSDVRTILKDYIAIKDQEHGTDVLSQLEFGEEAPAEVPPAEPVAAEPAPAPEAPLAAQPAPAAPAAPQPAMAESLIKAIEKARKAGATAETVIRIAGKEMTLGEAVAKAGMKVEDVFGNKSNELVEFIKSMYNAEEGSFPKGETGVLIACEKRFGDGAVPIAKKVIERLQQVNEMSRMKKLAGLAK